MTCSICWAQIEHRESCNAWPINDGRCCATCDDLIVTPVRITRSTARPITATIAVGLAMHARVNELRQKEET
jgi:hypothetical protein